MGGFKSVIKRESVESPRGTQGLLLAKCQLRRGHLRLFPSEGLPTSKRCMTHMIVRGVVGTLTGPSSATLIDVFMPKRLLATTKVAPCSIRTVSYFVTKAEYRRTFLTRARSRNFPRAVYSCREIFLKTSVAKLMPGPGYAVCAGLTYSKGVVAFPCLGRGCRVPNFCVSMPCRGGRSSVDCITSRLHRLGGFLRSMNKGGVSRRSMRHTITGDGRTTSCCDDRLTLEGSRSPIASLAGRLCTVFVYRLLTNSRRSLGCAGVLLRSIGGTPGKRNLRVL